MITKNETSYKTEELKKKCGNTVKSKKRVTGSQEKNHVQKPRILRMSKYPMSTDRKPCTQRKLINKRGTRKNGKDQSCRYQNQGHKETISSLHKRNFIMQIRKVQRIPFKYSPQGKINPFFFFLKRQSQRQVIKKENERNGKVTCMFILRTDI